MKTQFTLTIIAAIILGSIASAQAATTNEKTIQEKTVRLTAEIDLQPIVANWIDGYQAQYPERSIQLYPETEFIINENGVGFVYGSYFSKSENMNAWRTLIGRNPIVIVVNPKNPLLEFIMKSGVSTQNIAKLISSKDNQNWNNLLGIETKMPMRLLFSDFQQITHYLKDEFHLTSTAINAIRYTSINEFIEDLSKDVFTLGFCRLADITTSGNNAFVPNVAIVPIDRNNNNTIDAAESIYSDPQTLLRGMWIGKYPKALCRNIYAVSAKGGLDENQASFISWLLINTQNNLEPGFTPLTEQEKQASLRNILPVPTLKPIQPDRNNWIYILMAMVAILVLLALLIGRLFVVGSTSKNNEAPFNSPPVFFDENHIAAPKGLMYDKTHNWLFMQTDGNIKIGIDDFIHHIIGKIDKVQLLEVGKFITKGEPYLSIYCLGKQIELRAPISGKIINSNAVISDLKNTGDVTERWVYTIEPIKWQHEAQFLLLVEPYKLWLKNEFIRLKDFIAQALSQQSPQNSSVVLQEGGELKYGFLSDLSPKIWDDFQTKFIDLIQ